MSLNIKAGISATFQSLALSVLNKSDRVNALVDRISRGSVNRDTLAQSAWRNGLRVGASAASLVPQFGERAGNVAQHVETFLLADSTAEVQSAFKGLMHELLVPQLPSAPHPLFADLVAESVGHAGDVAAALVEEKGLERTLATLVARHGREVLADRLQVMLGGSKTGDFACRRLMEILDHGVLSNPAYVMEKDSKHGYLADLLYLQLSGGDTKPLEDRAVALLQSAPAGAQSVLQFARGLVPTGSNGGALRSGLQLLDAFSQEQPIEKVLATAAHAHPETKAALLQEAQIRFTALAKQEKYGKMLTRIFDRAILSNPAHVQQDSASYGYLADTLHAALTGHTQPLKERTVALIRHTVGETSWSAAQYALQLSGVTTATGWVLSRVWPQAPANPELAAEAAPMPQVQAQEQTPSTQSGHAEMLEKLLATLTVRHGKEPLLQRIGAEVSRLTGNDRLATLVSTVVNDTVLNHPDSAQPDDQRYGYLADLLHAGLTGETQPLKERTVALAPTRLQGLARAALNGSLWVAGSVNGWLWPEPQSAAPASLQT